MKEGKYQLKRHDVSSAARAWADEGFSGVRKDSCFVSGHDFSRAVNGVRTGQVCNRRYRACR
jgi:hypothetical protein